MGDKEEKSPRIGRTYYTIDFIDMKSPPPDHIEVNKTRVYNVDIA